MNLMSVLCPIPTNFKCVINVKRDCCISNTTLNSILCNEILATAVAYPAHVFQNDHNRVFQLLFPCLLKDTELPFKGYECLVYQQSS